MKFINRNAYVMVAVKGTGYCSSAFRAVKLIINNALRLAAINIIGDSLMFLGKITVVAGAGAIAFLMTDLNQYTDVESDTYLTSPVIPVLLAVVAAYVVASIFFSVRSLSARSYWRRRRLASQAASLDRVARHSFVIG